MVCYQVSAGNDAAKRAARGKHYVCFNLASDKGSELKAAHPLLKCVPLLKDAKVAATSAFFPAITKLIHE